MSHEYTPWRRRPGDAQVPQTGLAGCRIAPERSLTLSLNDGERVTDDGEVARATRAVPAVRSGR